MRYGAGDNKDVNKECYDDIIKRRKIYLYVCVRRFMILHIPNLFVLLTNYLRRNNNNEDDDGLMRIYRIISFNVT